MMSRTCFRLKDDLHVTIASSAATICFDVGLKDSSSAELANACPHLASVITVCDFVQLVVLWRGRIEERILFQRLSNSLLSDN